MASVTTNETLSKQTHPKWCLVEKLKFLQESYAKGKKKKREGMEQEKVRSGLGVWDLGHFASYNGSRSFVC